MSWTETAPGSFQRPLGGVETPMVSVISAGFPREPLQIHAAAEFTAPYQSDKVIEAFSEAWKALRLLKSPDIATTFADGQKKYCVSSPSELETWQKQTFIIAEIDTSVEKSVRDLRNRLEWLPVCSILPQSTEAGNFKGSIVIFISHWRTELGGAFKLLNQLFDYATDLLTGTSTRQALENYEIGSEVKLLTPTLEDVLMPDQQSTPESKTRIAKHFDNFYSKLPCIDYPMQGTFTDAGSEMKLNERTYTSDSTTNLVTACRAKGITLTAAVHSAYIGVAWDLAPLENKSRSYACLMPAEVRKRLPRSSPYRDQGCWNASSTLMLTTPPNQDLLTRARDLKRQYSLANDQTWFLEDQRSILDEAMQMGSKMPAGPSSTPWFTSLGVLDGDGISPVHGEFKISYVSGWADTELPGVVMRVWTFDGRLTIQIAWNATFHGDDLINTTLDMIDETLKTDLGVEMTVDEVRTPAY